MHSNKAYTGTGIKTYSAIIKVTGKQMTTLAPIRIDICLV
jgi:hypothetical protein